MVKVIYTRLSGIGFIGRIYMNQIISYAITILSLIGGILAWVAKLRWSKEYAVAKDETIRAKEAQIAVLQEHIKNLQDLTSPKLREYFESMKTQLEEYNDQLKKNLENADSTLKKTIEELKTKEAELKELKDKKKAEEEKQKLKAEIIKVNEISKLVRGTLAEATSMTLIKGDVFIPSGSIQYTGGAVLPDYWIKSQEAITRIIESNQKLNERLKIYNTQFKAVMGDYQIGEIKIKIKRDSPEPNLGNFDDKE
jgi:hypothetical protein